ncbi:uncharacterized protein LOC127862534 isoform X2 [Dreissena polymorpha]|uniref:uncharacterized protein LOC127862534 isoform X2 n=1 Tax=Dreissena polymorpha TaxID=45954 RepID=UPI0022644444|nr:uncharacterized protein LOC127862534 isoform X2 [Dreissena polymorpha]
MAGLMRQTIQRMSGKREKELTDITESMTLSSIHDVTSIHSFQPGEGSSSAAMKISQIRAMSSRENITVENEDDKSFVAKIIQILRGRNGQPIQNIEEMNVNDASNQIFQAIYRLLFLIGDVSCQQLLTELGLRRETCHIGETEKLDAIHLANIIISWTHIYPGCSEDTFLKHVHEIEKRLIRESEISGTTNAESPDTAKSSSFEYSHMQKETLEIVKQNHQILQELRGRLQPQEASRVPRGMAVQDTEVHV